MMIWSTKDSEKKLKNYDSNKNRNITYWGPKKLLQQPPGDIDIWCPWRPGDPPAVASRALWLPGVPVLTPSPQMCCVHHGRASLPQGLQVPWSWALQRDEGVAVPCSTWQPMLKSPVPANLRRRPSSAQDVHNVGLTLLVFLATLVIVLTISRPHMTNTRSTLHWIGKTWKDFF